MTIDNQVVTSSHLQNRRCDYKLKQHSHINNMVTTAAHHFNQSEKLKMLVNNNISVFENPLICVDGYLLCCQYDGETCTPKHGIKIEELLSSLKSEVENFAKQKLSDESPNRTTPKNKTTSRSKSLSKPFYKQNSRENLRRSLFSDPEEFLGISSESLENPLRNSFILPISGRRPASVIDEYVNERIIPGQKVSEIRQTELLNQVRWVEEHGCDYINTETVHNCSELLALLNILMKSSIPALITLKINSPTEITFTYQFMQKFKQDYMIVRINKSYCMLMKAF